MPLSPHARPRETRYWLKMEVGLYVPLNPLLTEAVETCGW